MLAEGGSFSEYEKAEVNEFLRGRRSARHYNSTRFAAKLTYKRQYTLLYNFSYLACLYLKKQANTESELAPIPLSCDITGSIAVHTHGMYTSSAQIGQV